MKYIKYILAACAVVALASCEKRHIDDDIYAPSVYIINNGLEKMPTFYDVEGSKAFTVNVFCAGYKAGNPEVKLTIDEEVLDSLNKADGTSYRLLPEDCYRITQQSLKMVDKKAAFEVVFDCNALKSLSVEPDYSDIRGYALPLALSSLDANIAVSKHSELNSTILVPDMSLMGFSFENAGKSSLKLSEMTESDGYYILVYKVSTPVENKWDSQVEFSFNKTVDGLENPLLPEGSYTVESSSSLGFVEGVSEITYTVKVDKTKLVDLFYSITAEVKSAGTFVMVGDGLSVINLFNALYYPQSKINWIDCNSYVNDARGPKSTLDGNLSTLWENAYSSSHVGVTSFPYYIVYDLGSEQNVVGFELYRRSGTYVTDLKAGYLEVSTDNVTYEKVASYDYGTSKVSGPFYHPCDNPVKARYVKYWATESNRKQLASLAEFNVLIR